MAGARTARILITAALAGAVLVGCGGDDGGGSSQQKDGGGGNADKPLAVDQYDVAYDAARTICSEGSVQQLAKELGSEPTPEAVAEEYAKGSTAGDARDGSRDGCLAGLSE